MAVCWEPGKTGGMYRGLNYTRIKLNAFCAHAAREKKIPNEHVYVLMIAKQFGVCVCVWSVTDTQACAVLDIATRLYCDSVCSLFVPQNNRYTAGSVL